VSYIHHYLSIVSITLYRVCWNSATSLTMTWKRQKHVQVIIVLIVVRIALTPSDSSTTRPVHVLHLEGNHLKNHGLQFWWCVGYIHSFLSVVSITYTISVGIVPTSLTTTWKASKACPGHYFSDFFLCIVLTPSDSSATRPRPRATSKGKSPVKPRFTILMMRVILALVSRLYLLLIPCLFE